MICRSIPASAPAARTARAYRSASASPPCAWTASRSAERGDSHKPQSNAARCWRSDYDGAVMGKREKVALELDSEAIAAAKAAGLDLSTVFLEALHRKLPTLHAEERAALARTWLEENRSAIE